MTERRLISACLLGVRCRYDGESKPLSAGVLAALMEKYEMIPVCHEVFGGLSTPRAPSVRRGRRVVMNSGEDVTAQYTRGAEETLRLARLFSCKTAVLKERSPSCGSGEIYDGTFGGKLTAGSGVTAELLKSQDIAILGESEIRKLL